MNGRVFHGLRRRLRKKYWSLWSVFVPHPIPRILANAVPKSGTNLLLQLVGGITTITKIDYFRKIV